LADSDSVSAKNRYHVLAIILRYRGRLDGYCQVLLLCTMSGKAKSGAKGSSKAPAAREVAAAPVPQKEAKPAKAEKAAAKATSSSSSNIAASKSTLPPCPVPEAQVLKATTALVNHIKAEKKSKGERIDLINEGIPLFVTIRQFRIPGREKSKPQRL
jgi:hypothetical protein